MERALGRKQSSAASTLNTTPVMQRRAFLAAAGALAAATQIPTAQAKAAASGACTSGMVPSASKSRVAPLIRGQQPGTLLSREEIAASVSGARAWKVRYISADVNGVLHEVSGLVIAPTAAGAACCARGSRSSRRPGS